MDVLTGFLARLSTAPTAPTSPGTPSPALLSLLETSPILKRNVTVPDLAGILEENRVAHIRGCRASGKTILALQLYKHYEEASVPVVFLNDWTDTQPHESSYLDVLVRHAVSKGYTFISRDLISEQDIVFILDEAHHSFQDTELWNAFLRIQHEDPSFPAGAKVCIFSRYGNQMSGPEALIEPRSSARDEIKQEVSIGSPSRIPTPKMPTFFDSEESSSVVHYFLVYRDIPYDCDVRAFISSITNRHPGAVTALLLLIGEVYGRKKNMDQIDLYDIVKILEDEDNAFGFLATTILGSCCVDPSKLTPEMAMVMQKAATDSYLEWESEAVRRCYEEGWLHREAIRGYTPLFRYALPSMLHLRLTGYLLRKWKSAQQSN
ncbi:uncharacterized protein N7459_007388 [Penicillium hispanicum]|uniref:uncharacterized protein n=1 Tax=Penicillium hispanicum TaxID=1080232 RepID=UPI00253FB16D|nr:uncharacterized protein N7459_007388 [Penicillium hispanicum]KAJ5578424.1 hypothetical protein N7459_007388 [Penicillium hispanicum]